jgi:hypothetical protein
MNDNQIAVLAMSDSVEKNHNSTNSFKVGKSKACLRIWQANVDFFPCLIRASISNKTEIVINYPYYIKREIPFEDFVNLSFIAKNYDLVCEMDSSDIEDAFHYCGNGPNYSDNWYSAFNRRSLSVGDVVEVVKDNKSEFFLCCRFGWTKISSEIKNDSKIPVFKFKE